MTAPKNSIHYFGRDVQIQALYLEKEADLGTEFLEAIASVKSMPESLSASIEYEKPCLISTILGEWRTQNRHECGL